MPAYVASPFNPPILAMKGVPVYLWGSFDPRIGNSNLALTKVASTGGTATVTVQLMNGPLPVVGELISIINAATSAFNVSRVAISAVAINAATGAGTIQFALSGTVVATADSGSIIVEPAEAAEALVNNTASIAAVFQIPQCDSQYTVPVSVTFPAVPTGVTVTLQRALKNNDAEFTNDTSAQVVYASSAYTSGPVVEATLERGYLYRLYVSGLTGNGTVIGKLG